MLIAALILLVVLCSWSDVTAERGTGPIPEEEQLGRVCTEWGRIGP